MGPDSHGHSAAPAADAAEASSLWATPRHDIPAGIAVFFVALPLCLGIALACGVAPISGLIAGAVGGLVVPWISRSPLSVSGPAAGLTAIVLVGVNDVGFSNFLACIALAGAMQFCFGFFRVGAAASIVPSSVIKGMLAAIGLVIIVAELPSAFGVTELRAIVSKAHPGATLITGVSFVILLCWKKFVPKRLTWLPSSLVIVIVATALAAWLRSLPELALTSKMMVQVPTGGMSVLKSSLPSPSFSALLQPGTWALAATIAVVASIESLLSLEAIDLLDPLKRKSHADQELLAQGVGNLVSGMLGGLPITSVIVRSSANVSAGGRNGLSAVVHGALLVIALCFFAGWLDLIPIPCLAVILIDVGWKLCHPAVVRAQARLGYAQLFPFAATAIAVFMTNLLKGVMLGVIVGIAFVLRENVRGALEVKKQPGSVVIRFLRDGTFLTKPALRAALARVPDRTRITVDANDHFIDFDIKETLAKFQAQAGERGRKIQIDLIGIDIRAAAAAASAH